MNALTHVMTFKAFDNNAHTLDLLSSVSVLYWIIVRTDRPFSIKADLFLVRCINVSGIIQDSLVALCTLQS